MKFEEAQKYYEGLSIQQAHRFNALVSIALKLGKPIEGAYSYACKTMEEDSDGNNT